MKYFIEKLRIWGMPRLKNLFGGKCLLPIWDFISFEEADGGIYTSIKFKDFTSSSK